MKKEKMYDFGMFGKWSESSLKEQLGYTIFEGKRRYYLPDDSPLQLKIDSCRPKHPESILNKYFRNKMFYNSTLTFRTGSWRNALNDFESDLAEYINDMVDYKLRYSEWWEQYNKVEYIIKGLKW